MKGLASSAALALLFGSLGCGRAGIQRGAAEPAPNFRADGYYHETYPLRVVFGETASHWPLAERWEVDNYQRGAQGEFMARKHGPMFDGTVLFDLDDDGVYETKDTYPRFELSLHHRRTAGSIWLSTLPLPVELASKELRVLLDRYVEAVSGTGTVVVQEFTTGQKAVVAGKRYATRVVELRPATLGRVPAISAVVEVANVDQLQLSPSARWERAKVVFVQPTFGYVREHEGPIDDRTQSWPVLVVVGYSNSARDFSRNLGDFDRFLGELELLGDREILMLHALEILDCLGRDSAEITLSVSSAGFPSATVGQETDDCMTKELERWSFPVTGKPRHELVRLGRDTRLPSRAPGGYREGALLPNPAGEQPAP